MVILFFPGNIRVVIKGDPYIFPMSVDCYIPAEMCTYETLRAGVYGGVKEPMGNDVHMLHINTQKFKHTFTITHSYT